MCRRPRDARRCARPENRERAFGRRAREVLNGCGLTEIKTIAFIPPADNARFPAFDRFGSEGGAPLKVTNPLSAELSELRLSLMPGLLAALRFNLNRQAGAFHGFEIAKVFAARGETPAEALRLAAVSYGDFALAEVGARRSRRASSRSKERWRRFFSRQEFQSGSSSSEPRRRSRVSASGTRRANQARRPAAGMSRRIASARSDAPGADRTVRALRT